MRSRTAVLTLVLTLGTSALLGHELFIKLDTYFLAPYSLVRVPILNGTFAVSEGAVTADRVLDIAVSGPDGIEHPGTGGWETDDEMTCVSIDAGSPGTHALGVSTRSRLIEMPGIAFNGYLESEGVPDVLDARRQAGELDRDVVERYSKHVKAIYQAGAPLTPGWDAILGFPAEIIPLANPYALAVGDEITVRCLVHGERVAGQTVIAGGESPSGETIEHHETRSDDNGHASFRITAAGRWYIKFIHMVPTDEEGVDYESNWATLTFEVR